MTVVDPLMLSGVSARAESVVYDVLDLNRNVIGRVNPSADSPPRLQVSTSARFTRTLSGVELDEADAAAINPASDRMRPSWVIEGTEYPLGVFLVADDRRRISTRPTVTERGWVDDSFEMAQPIETSVGFSAGTNLSAAILSALGGLLIDVQVDPTSAVLTEPVAWAPGTNRADIVESLCATAGFLPPHSSATGTYRCVTAPDLTVAVPDFTYPVGSVIVDESRVESDDWLSTPNRYIVINSAPTLSPVVGVFDVPASAPYSIAARGFVVSEVLDQQGVATFTDAQLAAMTAWATAAREFTTGMFATAMVPTHDVWNVVQVGTSELWLEVGWSATLVAGTEQQHELRRLYQ